MKTLFTSALLLAGIVAFGQTATKAAPTTSAPTTTAQTAQTTQLSTKAQELCKEWTLSKTENFGDQHDPTTEQKNDKLTLMKDGRYRLIMNGVAEGGTWTLDKSNVWITLTTDQGVVKKFKIIESTATSLKVDYRDADDVHNVLYYSAGVSQAR